MKKPTYIEDLHEFNFSRLEMPYEWGVNDCVTYTADALVAMTGTDYLEGIRGLWSDEDSAMRLLETFGGLAKAVQDLTGFKRIEDLNFVQRGDVCLIRDLDGRPTLGVCCGSEVGAPGEEGFVTVPMRHVRMAWRLE